MKVGDLVELLDSDDTNSPSTSSARDRDKSRDASRDTELLRGRIGQSGEQGSFNASLVYILPTIVKPTPDFVVSYTSITRLYTGTLLNSWTLIGQVSLPNLPNEYQLQ